MTDPVPIAQRVFVGPSEQLQAMLAAKGLAVEYRGTNPMTACEYWQCTEAPMSFFADPVNRRFVVWHVGKDPDM